MVSVELLPDGSASVTGVPLSPFAGWQHETMHALALGRFATYARRAAFELGWIGTLFDDEYTCFVGALELSVAGAPAAVRPSSRGAARLTVTAVARVSFSLRCELRLMPATHADGAEDAASTLLGVTQLTYVRVSRSTRRAAPLDDAMRERLAASVVEPAGALQRLDAAAFAWVTPKTRTVVPLRPGDFDFNGHLNQGVTCSLIVDGALGGDEQRVRRLRVDFLREVPRTERSDSIEVCSADGTDAKELRFIIRHGEEVTAIGVIEVADA